jgi:hypothetical protein
LVALERLVNAAMLREPANVSATLTVSYALGAAGVVTFVAVLLLPFTGEGSDEVPDRKGDMRTPGSDESPW